METVSALSKPTVRPGGLLWPVNQHRIRGGMDQMTSIDQINLNGGLTLAPLPGFERQAEELKPLIEELGGRKKLPTSVDIATPEFGLRDSDEPLVRLGAQHVVGHDCVVLGSGPGTYQMTGQLQYALGYVHGRNAQRIAAVLGYLPLCRSDKDEGALEFALAQITIHMIESAAHFQLKHIFATDLHAPQVVMAASRPGLIPEITMMRHLLRRVIKDALQEGFGRIIILYPDETAEKRFEKIAAQVAKEFTLDLEFLAGKKRRQSSSSTKLMALIGRKKPIRGALVVSIDDEMATAGSNCSTAEVVRRKYHARQYWSVVPHGVICKAGPGRLIDPKSLINRTYITDTIPPYDRPELQPVLSDGRLRVVSWLPELAQIIFFYHWNMDIHEIR